jgi:hypothetical protein
MRAQALILAWCSAAIALAAPPKVDHFFPAGGQRGQTVVVAAAGDFATWPVQVWADQPGVTATAEKDKGKFSIAIPPDATPGVVWLRAFNEEGAAALKPFVIGTLPEAEEAEPNDAPGKPQAIAGNVVVNGRLAKSGDVDGFAISLKQGQTLVASLQAHHILGSPMDAVLQICELLERRGKPEAFVVAQNHDTIGLDPQQLWTAKRDGNYLVRVFTFPSEPDSTIGFAGRDSFIYRLTLTTGGFADHALPLAVRRGQPAEIKLFGWNLPPSGTPLTIEPPGDPLASRVGAFQAEVPGSIPLALVDHASVVEQPGQVLELPVAVSGQLSQEREADSFSFNAKKGVKLQLACESRSLGYPLRALLKIKDEAGKTLAAAEPNEQKRDTELTFTPPADARYAVSLSDEHERGGMRFVYRLTIEAARPDFSLTVAAESFVLAADKPLEVPVTLAIHEGLAETIEIKAMNLPTGVTCDPVKSAAPPKTGEVVKLVFKASPEAAAASGPIQVIGTAGELTRAVNLSPGESTAVWLTVRK